MPGFGRIVETDGQAGPPYNPSSQRPRRRDRALALLTQDLKPRDVILAMAAIVVALGWTFNSPGKRLAAVEARITKNEKSIDALTEQLRFTNYLQCVQLRRSDPAAVPPGCAPVIESGSPR
jgi:hypothetical protein